MYLKYSFLLCVVFLRFHFIRFFFGAPTTCRPLVYWVLCGWPTASHVAAYHKTQNTNTLTNLQHFDYRNMRLIYNQGGINHAHEALRVENRGVRKPAFSSGEKMKIVRAVEKMLGEEQISLGVAAARLGTTRQNLINWQKNAEALSDSQVENRLSLHKGPMSILDDITQELIEYITHWRERGFPVTRMCLVRKIGQLKPDFLTKSMEACKMAISRFLAKHNMTHRVATHKA